MLIQLYGKLAFVAVIEVKKVFSNNAHNNRAFAYDHSLAYVVGKLKGVEIPYCKYYSSDSVFFESLNLSCS